MQERRRRLDVLKGRWGNVSFAGRGFLPGAGGSGGQLGKGRCDAGL